MENYGERPFFVITKPETLPLFLENLQIYIESKGIANEAQRRGVFLTSVCEETKRRLREWIHPRSLLMCTADELITALTNGIRPQINKGAVFNTLVMRFQQLGETGAQYMTILHEMAQSLDFGWHTGRLVLYQFKRGLIDKDIQTKLYAEQDIGVAEAVALATAAETSKRCVESVRPPEEVNAVFTRKPKGGKKSQDGSSKVVCFRCGEEGHVSAKCNLKYKDCVCTFCKRTGHLEKICKDKKKQNKKGTKPPPVNANYAETSNPPTVNSQPSLIVPPAILIRGDEYDIYHVQPGGSYDPPVYITLRVNGRPITFQIDGGAGKTMMSSQAFQAAFGSQALPDQCSKTQVWTWGASAPLPAETEDGWASVRVQFENQSYQLPILVRNVPTSHAPNLLGRNWIAALYGKNFLHKAYRVDELSVHSVQASSQSPNSSILDVPPPSTTAGVTLANLKSWVQQFPSVSGLGTGRYKGTAVHLHLKPGATPQYHRARPVPFPLSTRYDEAIDQKLEQGIWVPVETSDWASATVPVVKSNGSLRLCADYKCTLNPWLKDDTYRSPTLDEVLVSANGASYFSELDCKEAYLQVPIDEDSSKLMVVNTMRGLFRPTTLQFGVKTAPAIFQRLMDGQLGRIEGVRVYQDNIFIFSPTLSIHLERLKAVLFKLSDCGIRLNQEKCTWCASALDILGFRVDSNGVHPTCDKLAAIKNISPPSMVGELRSLLGLISFYGRFLQHKATILEPLHRLLDRSTASKKVEWAPQHQKALDTIKEQLSSESVLIHYSLDMPLVLAADASPYGVGCVLAHALNLPDGTTVERPIAYISRTLSSAERNYSQLDKEALAIIFGVTRLSQYLFGRNFKIYTDHRPLVDLFNPANPIPTHLSPRMLRWSLKLGAMDYEIMHRPGKLMGNADCLSRFPLPETVCEVEPCGIFLLECKDWIEITPQKIADATAVDPCLHLVLAWTQKGWPDVCPQSEVNLTPYWQKRNSLSILKGCLLWHERVIVPSVFRSEVLNLVHSLHYGIEYSKALARSMVWWPGIDTDITNVVRTCVPCQQTAKKPPRQMVSTWPKATRPMERVHIDYAGPFLGHHFLIIVDAFSQYPVIKMVSNLTAATLITHMRYFLADYGIPNLVVSDNGSQLVSESFKEFLAKNGVRHLTSPPYHPASNGLAERTVSTFKTLMMRFTTGDVHTRLARVLAAMRSRPSRTTGKCPAEVMGRPYFNRLSRLHPYKSTTVQDSPVKFQVGSCVYALKRTGNASSWVSGVLESFQGSRIAVVRLDSGGTLRVSLDEIRLRFQPVSQDDVGLQEPPEQPPVVPVAAGAATRNAPVPNMLQDGVVNGAIPPPPTPPLPPPPLTPPPPPPCDPPPGTGENEQNQDQIRNQEPGNLNGEAHLRDENNDPPVLTPQASPQRNVEHEPLAGVGRGQHQERPDHAPGAQPGPANNDAAPRGRGRPGRPRGSRNRPPPGGRTPPVTTKSGRIVNPPSRD